MSFAVRQGLLLLIGGALGILLITGLARRSLLSLRYTLGWIVIFMIGVLGAGLTVLVAPVANFFGMSPTGVLLAVATLLLLGITLQLSMAISQLSERLRDVAEAHALLRAESPTGRSPIDES